MKTDLEIAEEALAKWPTETMGILRTSIRNDLLLPAIAAARADGYRAGIEAAAKVLERNADTMARVRPATFDAVDALTEISAIVRALAPGKGEP